MISKEIRFPESLWPEIQRLIDAGYYSDVEDFVLSAVQLQIERVQNIRYLKDEQWIALSSSPSMKELQMALHQVIDRLLEIDEELHPSSTIPLISHLVSLKSIAEYLRRVYHVGSRNPELESVLTPIRHLLLVEDTGEGTTIEDVGTVLEAIVRYRRGDKDHWPGGQLEEMREAAQIARWIQSASTKISLLVDEIHNVINQLGESTSSILVGGGENNEGTSEQPSQVHPS